MHALAFAAAMTIRCDVFLDIQLEEGRPPVRCRLKAGGDCAATNSQSAIESPVFRAGGAGACARCTAPKKEFCNRALIKKARRRNFAYQVTANHRRVGPLLGGEYTNVDFQCPECLKVVDKALEAATLKKYAESSEERQKVMQRDFAASHAAGLEGRIPNQPLDNRSRARSMLHRRINAAGNNLAVTFLKRPYDLHVREKANALLKNLRWKFPLKKKIRARVPNGPDARALHSDPALLPGLFELFYEKELKEQAKAKETLSNLRATAENARNMHLETEAAAAAGRRVSQPQRKKNKRVRKADDEDVTLAGVAHEDADVQQYRRRRKCALAAATSEATDDACVRMPGQARGMTPTGALADCALTMDVNSTEGVEATPDNEFDADDSLVVDEEELEEDLPEDGKIDVISAINVWRTSILHQEAVAAPVKNRFDFTKVMTS